MMAKQKVAKLTIVILEKIKSVFFNYVKLDSNTIKGSSLLSFNRARTRAILRVGPHN